MTDYNVYPITPEQRRVLQEGKPVSTFMPIHVAGGSIDSLIFSCAVCGREINDHHTRVLATRPVDGLTVLSGFAVCPKCRTATPVFHRIHSDGRIVFRSPENRQWMQMRLFESTRPAWWDLAGWLWLFVRRILPD